MAGRTGGQQGGSWYNTLQSIPYQSQYRENQGIDSQIKGQVRNLDNQTTELLNRLKLQEIERDYENKELKLKEKEAEREGSRASGQQQLATAAMLSKGKKEIAKQAGNALIKLAPQSGIGSAVGMGAFNAISALSPWMMALGFAKALGAENKLVDIFGGRAKNALSPMKWDILPWNWRK